MLLRHARRTDTHGVKGVSFFLPYQDRSMQVAMSATNAKLSAAMSQLRHSHTLALAMVEGIFKIDHRCAQGSMF
ncbi:hypothetical protein H6F76_20735 [Leptolyngbya sp. FACHB-321]|uniref:hypothetical protein n=1 Tax=Leptolyngbya sp. FACHB-321 TaxID=2692807 RepID=UPI00168359AC|nr:hypothetical protein [Leptolyngbya sp. FACHB-321]MBD2037392.1 hypothetical protein [Leptolyngbya sp. FACHB-321]